MFFWKLVLLNILLPWSRFWNLGDFSVLKRTVLFIYYSNVGNWPGIAILFYFFQILCKPFVYEIILLLVFNMTPLKFMIRLIIFYIYSGSSWLLWQSSQQTKISQENWHGRYDQKVLTSKHPSIDISCDCFVRSELDVTRSMAQLNSLAICS